MTGRQTVDQAPTWDDLKTGTLTLEQWVQLSADEAAKLVGEQWRGTWGGEAACDGDTPTRHPRPGAAAHIEDESGTE